MFAMLMVLQWLTGIALALWISPRAWSGAMSRVHPHVWVAVFLNGVIASLPVVLALIRPGQVATRHAIAVGQMLTSSILIHLSGGRIETHFHIFGSLAFLAVYRDWRVLITASAVAAADHILRGWYWPQSIYGSTLGASWRWIEHVGWVVFADVFLIRSCIASTREMREIAIRTTQLEATNAAIEQTVVERTAQLQASEERSRTIIASTNDAFIAMNTAGEIVDWNQRAEVIFGWSREEVLKRRLEEIVIPPQYRERHVHGLQHFLATGEHNILNKHVELDGLHRDGHEFPVEMTVSPVRLKDGWLFTAFVHDISPRKRAEAELATAHHLLLDTARRAGMAEIATGVLHNVGNVLNGVNVSATIVLDRLQRSRLTHFVRAVQLLQDHSSDLAEFLTSDDKGKKLPHFLCILKNELCDEQAMMLKEVEAITQKVDHIKTIVTTQQSYAGVAGVIETIDIAAAIDDALRLESVAFQQHHITVVREYDVLPRAKMDKQKLLQILVNLVKNAKESLLERDEGGRTLTLRATLADASHVRIAVSDNGAGIAQENVIRIFSHGFTTKRNGHGFGLHSCANAAKELRGSLHASSDGPGTGAAFTLELPFTPVSL
jgi:PAS domain S-box-containing protein